MDVLAVILGRKGSRRLPGKNTRIIAGKPMVQWTIEYVESVSAFTDCVASTDCPDMRAVCESLGVTCIEREDGMSGDDSSILLPFRHAVKEWERLNGKRCDVAVLLQANVPIRQSGAIDSLISLAAESPSGIAYTVTETYIPYLFDENISAMQMSDHTSLTVKHLDNCAYVFLRESLETDHLTAVVRVVVQKPRDSVEVDTEDDFRLAEMILNAA